jgi:tetratricopeptide (TPR) repeat protein
MRHWVAGDADSAAAAATSLAADSSANQTYRALATEYGALIASARGRLDQAARSYARTADFGPMGASRLLLAAPTAATAQALVLDRPADGRATLERFLTGARWTALAPADRPYAEVALAAALVGSPDRALALLAEEAQAARSSAPPGLPAMPASRQDSAAALAVKGVAELDRGRLTEAASLLDAADRLSARAWYADLAAMAWDRLGAPDSAIARYQRFLDSGFPYRMYLDATRLGPALDRLGQLYEAKGERGLAAESYQRVLDLWRNADPELRPRIGEIRRRLGGLDSPS